jgi:pyruvate kinase
VIDLDSTRIGVVATVGPACADPAVLARLVEAGAGVLRLNMSHGDLAAHQATLETIRGIERTTGTPIAVMAMSRDSFRSKRRPTG